MSPMESARFQGAGAAEHSHLTEHHAASSDRAACPAGAGSSGACHLNGVCSPEAPTPARSPGRQGSRTRGRPVPGTPGGPYKGKGRPSQAAHQRRGTSDSHAGGAPCRGYGTCARCRVLSLQITQHTSKYVTLLLPTALASTYMKFSSRSLQR